MGSTTKLFAQDSRRALGALLPGIVTQKPSAEPEQAAVKDAPSGDVVPVVQERNLGFRIAQGVRIALEAVDHVRARALLDASSTFRNRSLKKEAIARYLKSMLNGKFALMFDPIHVDKHGRIINGQNRMHALVRAGARVAPIDFLFVYGLDEADALLTDDVARKSGKDFLDQAGFKNAGLLAAAARWLHAYEEAGLGFYQYGLANWEIPEFVADYPGLEDSVSLVLSRLRKVVHHVGMAAALHYIFSGIDAELASEMVDGLSDGAELERGSPIHLLREKLIALNRQEGTGGRALQEYVAALFIKTWNLLRTGRRNDRLLWVSDREDFPAVEGVKLDANGHPAVGIEKLAQLA